MPLNISYKKEISILVAGPIFQIIAANILINIFPTDRDLILMYHNSILLFNLLPIYPLDGGKFLNIFLSLFFPYKTSIKVTIYLSYLLIIIIFFIQTNKNINILIMVILLITVITKELTKINYLYQKFLLERYLNNYNFSKSKIISSKEKFKRNYRHLIKNKGKYYSESEYLSDFFKKNKKIIKNR